jgi:hypothetical protein
MSEKEDQLTLWLQIGDEVRNLATFAVTGSFASEPRFDIRTVLDVVQTIAEAAQARTALQRDRPVRPKQLAALARTNTERLRQLPRTTDGQIAPTAAREFLVAAGVPSVASMRFDLTPSWWRATIPGDRARRMALSLLQRGLPAGATIDEQLTSITVVVPGGGPLPPEVDKYVSEKRGALESARP